MGEVAPIARDVVTYLGGVGTVLSAALQLSDGSFLIGGSSPNLEWLPDETEVVELSLPASDSAALSSGHGAGHPTHSHHQYTG